MQRALSGQSCILPQEGRKIVTVKDVEPEQFIKAFSQHLKRQGTARTPPATAHGMCNSRPLRAAEVGGCGKDEQGKGAATFRAWTATTVGMDFTLWISETALVPSLGI